MDGKGTESSFSSINVEQCWDFWITFRILVLLLEHFGLFLKIERSSKVPQKDQKAQKAKISKNSKIGGKDRNKLQLLVSFGLSVLFWRPRKDRKTESFERKP